MQTVRIQISQLRYIVRSGTLLYFVMFYSTHWFYKRTVKALPDCANAQSDLGLHCPHLPKDTLLHGKAHMPYLFCLTLSAPNFIRHLSSAFFFTLTNYRLERRLYVKLKDWMSISVDTDETTHYDYYMIIIIAYGSEGVKLHVNGYVWKILSLLCRDR